MELEPAGPSVKGPAETFTGDVYFNIINKGVAPSRMNVNIVRFAPGAHTAWHSHAVGQTLHVTDGIGLIQSRGGQLIRMRPGDTVYTPPGEERWHGATAENFMCHLAMWESAADGQGPDTTWGEHLTDQEYQAAAAPSPIRPRFSWPRGTPTATRQLAPSGFTQRRSRPAEMLTGDGRAVQQEEGIGPHHLLDHEPGRVAEIGSRLVRADQGGFVHPVVRPLAPKHAPTRRQHVACPVRARPSGQHDDERLPGGTDGDRHG